MPSSAAHALRTACFAAVAALGLGVAVPGSVAQQTDDADRGFDLSQPIEIRADSLELRQKESVAVFIGNVDAVQGRIRLSADRLFVHYRTKDGEKSPAAVAGGAISRLDARGKVSLTSPTETAKSKTGIYDVDKQLVTLEGDVVLTRGANVLSGARLVINLATGVSKFDGRVTGVFKSSQVQN